MLFVEFYGRPEMRVMSVSSPVNTTAGKICEGIFTYVSVFQFKITKFSGIFEGLYFLIYLFLLYTLSSGKMKT